MLQIQVDGYSWKVVAYGGEEREGKGETVADLEEAEELLICRK